MKIFNSFRRDFESKLEDYQEDINIHRDNFVENLRDFENFEINVGFIKVYNKVFEVVLNILVERIKEFEDLNEKENEEVFRVILYLLKIKTLGEWNQEYDVFQNYTHVLRGNPLKIKTLDTLNK